jgi:cytochrome b561
MTEAINVQIMWLGVTTLARKVALVRTQVLSAGGSQRPIDLKRRARQAILQMAHLTQYQLIGIIPSSGY